ncbi:MAG: hypothetical protein QW732_07875 [Zestosphaera sp.]
MLLIILFRFYAALESLTSTSLLILGVFEGSKHATTTFLPSRETTLTARATKCPTPLLSTAQQIRATIQAFIAYTLY